MRVRASSSFPEAFKDLPAGGRDQQIFEEFRITCKTHKSDWDLVTGPQEITNNFTALLSILAFKSFLNLRDSHYWRET